MAKRTAKKESVAVEQDDVHARWVAELDLYDREFGDWEERAKKIVERYKDERSIGKDTATRFNVLWANTRLLLPALYAQDPKPQAERRFKDPSDQLGRIASEVLERCLTYCIQAYPFGAMMRQAVLDRLLPGRGTVWVRYVPHFRDMALQASPEVAGTGSQVSEDVPQTASDADEEKPQEVYYEEAVSDFVNWTDFGHTWARTWEEVTGVWRGVCMTRAELVKRFGKEAGNKVPLDWAPKKSSGEKVREDMKKARIYEIWDKTKKQALWLSKAYPKVLDTKDDPLKLTGFFPCPRPLYATLANDSLVPVPDYAEYQDQAREIDDLTQRIASISKSLKVVGVYDASAPALGKILLGGHDNKLIPVDSWAAFAEKGGLKGAIDWIPIREIAEVLMQLYQARATVKQDLDQITGLADIVRGQTDPRETLGAQKLKGQYATLRLSDDQSDVQRFARDLVSIKGQIIANQFSVDTLKTISGMKLPMQAEKDAAKQQWAVQQQQIMAMASNQMSPRAPPAPPPQMPPDMQKMLATPSWEDVKSLLSNNALRDFRIDIETDSTIKADQEAEKTARMEFVAAVGGFMKVLPEVMQSAPQLGPMIGEVLMFAVRGFKTARSLEGSIETAMQSLNSRPPSANPEAQKQAQQQAQEQQKQIQQAGQKVQQDQIALTEQAAKEKANIDAGKVKAQADAEAFTTKAVAEAEAAVTKMTAAFEALQAKGEAMKAAQPEAAPEVDQTMQIALQGVQEALQGIAQAGQAQAQAQAATAQAQAAQAQAAMATKQVVRDQMGRAVAIQPMAQ